MSGSFGRRIKRMQKDSAERLTRMDQWFRYWLPYSFVKLETTNHNHVYLPVNRNYKPLGVTSDDWVDYEDFIDQAVIFSADPHTFANVWFHRDTLHLYEDVVSSRVDYFQRLERLLSRSVKLFQRSN